MSQDVNRRDRRIDDEGNEIQYGSSGSQPQRNLNINPVFLSIGAVIVSLVAVYFLFGLSDKMTKADATKIITTSQTELTKTITDMVAPFKNLKADITASNAKQIADAMVNVPNAQIITNIQNTADTAKKNSETAVTNANEANTKATDAKSTADGATQKANSLQIELESAKNEITNLKAANASKDVEIASIKTSLTTINSNIAAINSGDIDSGDTSTSDTTSSTGISVTKISGTSTSYLTYELPANGDIIDKYFQIKVTNNNTSKDATDMNLCVTLTDSRGNLDNSSIDELVGLVSAVYPANVKMAFSVDGDQTSTKAYFISDSFNLDAGGDYIRFYLHVRMSSTIGEDVTCKITPSFKIVGVNWE